MRSKQGLHGGEVVIGRDQRFSREGGGDAQTVGRAARQAARTRTDEEAVRMAVVAAFELDDLVPARKAAGDADGGHRRLRARIDQAHHLHVRAGEADLFGEQRLRARGRAEAQPARSRRLHRRHHGGMGVAEDQRAPAHHIIGIDVTVCVEDPIPFAAVDEQGVTSHRAEGAHGGIDAAGKDGFGALEKAHGILPVHQFPSFIHAAYSRARSMMTHVSISFPPSPMPRTRGRGR